MSDDAERLRVLYELSRRLGSVTGLDDLLHFATARIRELLDADSCALLLYDPDRHELYFPVASQRASGGHARNLTEIRFSASKGIAGSVLEQGQALVVEDVSTDARFSRDVDNLTGTTTRSLVYAPLRADVGVCGLLSVCNPKRRIGPEDVQFLEAIATDVGLAFDRASRFERLRDEARQVKWTTRTAGVVVLAIGAFVVLGTLAVDSVVSAPLSYTIRRPAFWMGIVVVGIGGWLLAGMRRATATRSAGPGRR